jgi:tetratricopeptide (TPR) repeat protein
MKTKFAGVLVCAWLGFSTCILAQAQPLPDEAAATANAAFQAKDWAKARPLYERLTKAQPDSYLNWFRLGVCLRETGEHQGALEAFGKAQAKGLPASIAGYNISTVLASMGRTEKAVEALTEAVKNGFSQPDRLLSDPGFSSIRSDSRFAPLVEQAKRNQTPCAYKTENRQFDFWVGDWDVVTTKEGATAGTSHIERTLGDCVIWENWTSLGNSAGYAGKSYNIYNPDLARWEQFWVDNMAGMIHFYGGLKDGVMDFYTDEVPQSDGTRLKRHLQFFNLGADRVRQFSQGSTDGGKTWTVEYDLTYNRRK